MKKYKIVIYKNDKPHNFKYNLQLWTYAQYSDYTGYIYCGRGRFFNSLIKAVIFKLKIIFNKQVKKQFII